MGGKLGETGSPVSFDDTLGTFRFHEDDGGLTEGMLAYQEDTNIVSLTTYHVHPQSHGVKPMALHVGPTSVKNLDRKPNSVNTHIAKLIPFELSPAVKGDA